jgi:hypothetical protein
VLSGAAAGCVLVSRRICRVFKSQPRVLSLKPRSGVRPLDRHGAACDPTLHQFEIVFKNEE